MKGIVLAGGSGTRLHPVTAVTSKQLLPVYDKPMIYYPLATLMEADIRDILIISTPRDLPTLEVLLGDGERFGINLQYIEQPVPAGLAQAFLLGADFIGQEEVTMILGDNIFLDTDLPAKLRESFEHAKKHSTATIFGYPVEDPQRFGIATVDDGGRVLTLEEKPAHPKSNCCVTGLYCYDARVVEFAAGLEPSARGELEITDLNRLYLEEGALRLEMLSDDAIWMDTGTCDSLAEASNLVQKMQRETRRQIACLEEIAFKKGWLTEAQLCSIIETYADTPYTEHLKMLI